MAEKDKKKAAPPPPADDSSDSSSSDSDDANFSEETLQKAEGMKIEMEQYYQNLYKSMSERAERYARIPSSKPDDADATPPLRRKKLEAKLAEKKVSEDTRTQMRRELAKKENEFLRQRRIRLTGRSFESLKIIGRGAFGEVRTARARGYGILMRRHRCASCS